MCDVPSTDVFCKESIGCVPGIACRFFLKLRVIIIIIIIIINLLSGKIKFTSEKKRLNYSRSALFWYFTRRRMLVSYRRFGNTC